MRPLLVLAALVAVACAASIDTEERLLEKLQQILAQGEGEKKDLDSRYIPSSMTMQIDSSSIAFTLTKLNTDPSSALYQVKYKQHSASTYTSFNAPCSYSQLGQNGKVTISGLDPGTAYDLASFYQGSTGSAPVQRGAVRTITTSSAAGKRMEVKFFD